MIGRLSLVVVNHRVGSLGLWPEPSKHCYSSCSLYPNKAARVKAKEPCKRQGSVFPPLQYLGQEFCEMMAAVMHVCVNAEVSFVITSCVWRKCGVSQFERAKLHSSRTNTKYNVL